MRSVAVYCGSSPGFRPEYSDAAQSLGAILAHRRITLVYGGGHVGLMGVIADACLEAGGEVHGVITEALRDAEVAHPGLTRLEVVPDMHQRKERMASLADGFVAMPGGFGTWEELFEVVTWSQLGTHSKPVCLLDVLGFFDHLLAFARHAAAEGFIKDSNLDLIRVTSDANSVLATLEVPMQPRVAKWAGR